VDGNELLKRRGKGELVGLVQINDSAGHAYQSHGAIRLDNVKDEAKGNDVVYTQDAFVVPGDYTLSLVMFDSSNGDHNVAKRTLHVAPLRADPLADAWQDLPPVEFVPGGEAPDVWFMPALTSHLLLPLETRRPVHIDLLVNASPSETAETPRRNPISSPNLSIILPALKVLSQVQVRNGTLNLAVLDLSRRKVSFQQSDVRELDWPGLKTGLAEASPDIINVHALEQREQDAQFFVTEVNRRWSEPPNVVLGNGAHPDSAKSTRVLIVLSAPMSFASGADLHPIKAAKDPNQRIFYIRYRPTVPRPFPPPEPSPFERQRGAMGRGLPRPPAFAVQQDSLEGTLKPLDPRLFDVETPEQFRKALAVILSDISRM